MSGLRKICRMYGAMTIQGVEYLWDYVREEPVKKSEQTHEQWVASEKRKYELMMAQGEADSSQDEKPF